MPSGPERGSHPIRWLVGIDGGATTMRAAITAIGQDQPYATITAAGVNLGRGVETAWNSIEHMLAEAFRSEGIHPNWSECALGIGIAGANNPEWLESFLSLAPDFGALALDTDGFVHLLGAHCGEPGAILALGTGSIGEVLLPDGERRVVGGYGFPAGDRASGAWLGQKLSLYLQDMLDRRADPDDLARAIMTSMDIETREQAVSWLSAASPSKFATLAPLAFDEPHHPYAAAVLAEMGNDAAAMLDQLDDLGADAIALCGGLADPIRPYLPDAWRERIRAPRGDGSAGALLLAQRALTAA